METKKLKYFGLNKLAPILSRYKIEYFLMIASCIAGGVADIIFPLFQRYAIDNFIARGTLGGLPAFTAVYIAVIAVFMAVNFVGAYNCCKLEMFVLRDMRRTLFNSLQSLSVSYFNIHSVGKTHARVMSDPANVSSILSWGVFEGVWNIIYIIGAISVMLALDPLLALCVICVAPLLALASAYFQKRLTKLNRRVREINSEITGGFNEGITGAQTGKTLAIEDRLDARFFAKTSVMRKTSNKLWHFKSLFMSITVFASSVAIALVLWYGGIIAMEGVLFIGTLSAFMTYAQGLVDPVMWCSNAVADLISLKVNMERFVSVTEAESDVKDKPEVIEKYGDAFNEKRENWEKMEGEIEFKDVSFRYPDGNEWVLKNFNLKVAKGSNVAIVGETGAGKSTLVNLVCRFFEPTEGAVLIDGKDARERSVQWLHSNIGYVLQTPHLFSGTVRENLLYGKADATESELDAACASVGADKVIARLEKGYDSVVGEGGNTLSTGEKQLLSFARAILADPALFILDEATSSVDTITEQLIQQAIEKLMRGRTSFVIAHRLSTIKNADIILVVDGGKIIERGTHTQLLKAKGAYYNLYIQQFREEQLKKY